MLGPDTLGEASWISFGSCRFEERAEAEDCFKAMPPACFLFQLAQVAPITDKLEPTPTKAQEPSLVEVIVSCYREERNI